MDISGTDAGHLVAFDMRPGGSWAETARSGSNGGALMIGSLQNSSPTWSVTKSLRFVSYLVTLRPRPANCPREVVDRAVCDVLVNARRHDHPQ